MPITHTKKPKFDVVNVINTVPSIFLGRIRHPEWEFISSRNNFFRLPKTIHLINKW